MNIYLGVKYNTVYRIAHKIKEQNNVYFVFKIYRFK